MINITLLWMMLIPLALSIATVFVLPKLSSDFDILSSAKFAGVGLVISLAIMAVAFSFGKGIKTGDTEIWSGQITGKKREHGSYVRSYSCNCVTTTSNGSSTTTCQTCYEDHYTVDWTAQSTIGGYDIKSLDWTSSSVYKEPDPPFYTSIKTGEPCSKTHSYTNYIKAVPESLFRPTASQLKEKFTGMVPAYPLHIFDYWHINRVIPVKLNVPDIADWNAKVSESLKSIGGKKQANFVIVLANTDDPDYAYAIRDAWINGKKNDIVLIIGAPEFPKKASWVHVLALTDNELFKVQLRDDILALDSLTADAVINTLSKDTMELYKRKRMRDFAYLDAEIDPPLWVNVTTIIFIIAAYIGFWIFGYRQSNTSFTRRRSYN